jgi:membrane protein DedA with SNARE-associated domain
VQAAAIVGVVAPLHHQVQEAGLGYLGLGLAALVSWIGAPGPGEAALIAAGILAGRGHADLLPVLACAWLGATVGGSAGWLVGLRAGRSLASPAGPLAGPRRVALERGSRFYDRFGVFAVFLTPSWVAGIHGMRAARYLPANALAALAWAVMYGAGAYLIGPDVTELASDVGLLGGVVVAGLILAVLAAAVMARTRRAG